MNIKSKVIKSINRYDRWIDQNNYMSNDPYDIWSNTYGILSKKIFYKNKLIGGLCIIPLLIIMFHTALQKRIGFSVFFPICLAHIGIKLLLQKNNILDTDAKNEVNKILLLIDSLKDKNTTGLGWGLPFDWQTNNGLIPGYSACTTQTPYILDFLLQLEKLNFDMDSDYWIRNICDWAAFGIKETKRNIGTAAAYSTKDKRLVINANAYRAYILAVGSSRYGDPYKKKYEESISYVLGMQHTDGSWLYGEHEKDRFIDHYHTAFVLKNLIKCSKLQSVKGTKNAIESGKQYYLHKLFDNFRLPKPFSIEHRFQIHRYDSYDFAECIGLLSETGWDNHLLDRVVDRGIDLFQTNPGWFRYRVFKISFLETLPFLRHANTAFALGLQKYLFYSKQ